jgi:hypothetical protein
MKMKHSNSNTQYSQFFASALVALSLFGFLFPHHVNSGRSGHRVNMVEKIQTHQSDDDWGYKPPASPGSHRGWQFGS